MLQGIINLISKLIRKYLIHLVLRLLLEGVLALILTIIMKVISKLISWVFLNYDQMFKIVYQETSKYNLNIKSIESNALLKKSVYDNKFYVTSLMNHKQK